MIYFRIWHLHVMGNLVILYDGSAVLTTGQTSTFKVAGLHKEKIGILWSHMRHVCLGGTILVCDKTLRHLTSICDLWKISHVTRRVEIPVPYQTNVALLVIYAHHLTCYREFKIVYVCRKLLQKMTRRYVD